MKTPGFPFPDSTVPPFVERRAQVQPCTPEQLEAVAENYAAYMRGRGVIIGKPEETAIRRAAAIQDAWRVAFARVLK